MSPSFTKSENIFVLPKLTAEVTFFFFLLVQPSFSFYNFPTMGPRTLRLVPFKITGWDLSYVPKFVQIGEDFSLAKS